MLNEIQIFLKKPKGLATTFVKHYFVVVFTVLISLSQIGPFKIFFEDWWRIFAVSAPIALFSSVLCCLFLTNRSFKKKIERVTSQIISDANIRISRTGTTFYKKEIDIAENLLKIKKPVLITGEAGTGKSGVGVALAKKAKDIGFYTLIVDSRQLRDLKTEKELSDFYDCQNPLENVIEELSSVRGVRLIIDQLDNIADTAISRILINLAIKCSEIPGIQVVTISRRREAYEAELLKELLVSNFSEIECRELDESDARQELSKLGIANPALDLVWICKNLLNLEIVADITASDPTFSFSGIKDEIVLWGGYVNVLYLRESKASGLATAQQILADAKRLAKEALISGDLILRLDNPLPSTYRSLVSWGILVSMKGVLYSFKHEKLRDYLYASFAAEHEYMSKAIVLEIGPIRSRNILVWLEEIYRISDPQIHIKYLEAVLDG